MMLGICERWSCQLTVGPQKFFPSILSRRATCALHEHVRYWNTHPLKLFAFLLLTCEYPSQRGTTWSDLTSTFQRSFCTHKHNPGEIHIQSKTTDQLPCDKQNSEISLFSRTFSSRDFFLSITWYKEIRAPQLRVISTSRRRIFFFKLSQKFGFSEKQLNDKRLHELTWDK